MMRQLNNICLVVIVALLCARASAEEARPSERWHVDAAPASRLVHGWMSLQRDGDSNSLLIREHAGGGTDQNGVSEPLDLSISWFRDNDGKMRLVMSRIGNEKAVEVKSTPSIPKDAELRVQEQEKVAAISEKYQVLWRADVMQKDNVLSTLIYVARLAPIKDGVEGFDGDEARKALEAVKKAAIAK